MPSNTSREERREAIVFTGYVSLSNGPPKNDSIKQYFYFLEFDIQAFPTEE